MGWQVKFLCVLGGDEQERNNWVRKSAKRPASWGLRWTWPLDNAVRQSAGVDKLWTTLCLRKTSPFYICYNLVICYPILSLLGRNILQESWNKHKCTTHHISFQKFILYLVKSSNDFYVQHQIWSLHIKVKLSHQITIRQRSYYLSKCLKSRPSVFTQAWSIASLMTRWCRPDQITVRILTENLYKLKDIWAKKLIREFSDKGLSVKSLNKLLKKLRDSASVTTPKRPTSRCAFWCVASFYKVQYEHVKPNVN